MPKPPLVLPPSMASRSRRHLLLAGMGTGLAAAGWCPASLARTDDLVRRMAEFALGAPVREGRVRLEVAPLVDNGNTVPVTVTVDSPMTEQDHVTHIAIFNERNPQPDVALFRLGTAAGVATVSTRIRLATTQRLVAMARMADGRCWAGSADVVVTLAACIETSEED